MNSTIYLVRTALLAAIGLMLAACTTAPAPYGDYGPAGYYAYDYAGPPVYDTFDFGDVGGWHQGWDHGWHGHGHFVHAGAHGFGHGFAHVGGGGHRG